MLLRFARTPQRLAEANKWSVVTFAGNLVCGCVLKLKLANNYVKLFVWILD